MKVVGWEEKRGSIKTGQLGTGFLGQGFSPGSRVYSFRKFPRLSLPITEDFIPRYPAYWVTFHSPKPILNLSYSVVP